MHTIIDHCTRNATLVLFCVSRKVDKPSDARFERHWGYSCGSSNQLLSSGPSPSEQACGQACLNTWNCDAFSQKVSTCNLYSGCHRLKETDGIAIQTCAWGCRKKVPYHLYKKGSLTCSSDSIIDSFQLESSGNAVFDECADACLAAKGNEYGEGCSAFVVNRAKTVCTLHSTCEQESTGEIVWLGSFRCVALTLAFVHAAMLFCIPLN